MDVEESKNKWSGKSSSAAIIEKYFYCSHMLGNSLFKLRNIKLMYNITVVHIQKASLLF